MRMIPFVILAGAVFASGASSFAADPKGPVPPVAPKHPVFDTYWGVRVEDDYQYLEQMADPEVIAWARGQNDAARAWLDACPERRTVLSRIVALTHSPCPEFSGIVYRRGIFFATERKPPKEQPFIVTLSSVADTSGARVVLDPNVIDPSGSTSIDFSAPSLDGRYLAASLSQGGSENGSVHVFEVATGRELPDAIPRVNGGTAGGSLAWNADASGFFYTRYPREGERPDEDLPFYQQIWFHTLGDPIEKDVYVLGREFPKIAEIGLSTSDDGKTILIDVNNGDGGEHGFWIMPAAGGPAAQIARFEDKIVDANFGPDGSVYLLSRQKSPNGEILRLDPGVSDLTSARVVAPAGDPSIEGYLATKSRLYVIEMAGGPNQVRVRDLADTASALIKREQISDYSGLVRLDGDNVLIRIESYTEPFAYYQYAPGQPRGASAGLDRPGSSRSGKLVRTALALQSPADFGDCEVVREFATADDGTRIPINIILKKGTKRNGRNPTLLYGYGSYGLCQSPNFDPARRIWIERGGVFVVANIRGGGEFGDAWHRAANLERKKTSMDDFAACARWLVANRYTSREHLAFMGGSAGGLLMYGVMIHYPDLARAVVARVGYGDVLRTELSPNGLFNTTEFGTVKDETQFKGMYAYSPYHHVQDGTEYPAVLAMTGLNDPRVEPWQSFKMAARLQTTGTHLPVLLRTSSKAGHGIGTALSENDQEEADLYTFLFKELGVGF